MKNYKKFTLLVSDEEQILREAIAFDLKRKGFTVLLADNGSKALEVVKSKKVHLVISDIRIPEGDGLSLLEKIRAIDPTLPTVILATGFSDASEEDCLAKGAHRVLLKPFDRKDLMNTVLEALGLPILSLAA
jgi:CheY-like chemotaxis protein